MSEVIKEVAVISSSQFFVGFLKFEGLLRLTLMSLFIAPQGEVSFSKLLCKPRDGGFKICSLIISFVGQTVEYSVSRAFLFESRPSYSFSLKTAPYETLGVRSGKVFLSHSITLQLLQYAFIKKHHFSRMTGL